MKNIEQFDIHSSPAWRSFIDREHLSEQQAEQFALYLKLLIEWNQRFNITSIESIDDIIAYHFQDSVRILDFVSFKPGQTVCDVGSGGGFPGIPLKILNPEVAVILVEVNLKKEQFLNAVIEALGLQNVEVCTLDWRTFLRQSPFEHIDYFLARASLQLDELVRVFKGNSIYQNSTLIYWASETWHPEPTLAGSIQAQHEYSVGKRLRKFIIFKKGNVK